MQMQVVLAGTIVHLAGVALQDRKEPMGSIGRDANAISHRTHSANRRKAPKMQEAPPFQVALRC
jgi:hypothetical protein